MLTALMSGRALTASELRRSRHHADCEPHLATEAGG
jgi:hypothetical protein